MFALARKSLQAQLVPGIDGTVNYATLDSAADGLLFSGQYTFEQLVNNLTSSIHHSDRDFESLIILGGCLRHREHLRREPGDLKYAKVLLSWISITARPVGRLLVKDEVLEEEERAAELALKRSLATSTFSIKSIREIVEEVKVGDVGFDLLLWLVMFTEAGNSWTSDQLCTESLRMLDSHTDRLRTEDFIIHYVLNGFIRPLFSKSKPAAITSQGRKAINVDGNANRHVDMDDSNKPWKYDQVSAVTVLKWVVERSDEAIISKYWHLFIPPLLTLLDDNSTTIRVSGLQILKALLGKISAKILRQTSLGEVFEDAVMPTLLFLPSLTPTDESLTLLPAAYDALLLLGDVRFPTTDEKVEKLKFLDRVMRQGLLQGVDHCRDNVEVLKMLLGELRILVCRMGMHAVKHLKDIVPMLSTTLADPFGPANAELLWAATKATQTTILNCWPRMRESVHRLEIVKALSLCWYNVNEDIALHPDDLAKLGSVKAELKVAGIMLVKSVESTVDLNKELAPLLKVNRSLGELFGFQQTSE